MKKSNLEMEGCYGYSENWAGELARLINRYNNLYNTVESLGADITSGETLPVMKYLHKKLAEYQKNIEQHLEVRFDSESTPKKFKKVSSNS